MTRSALMLVLSFNLLVSCTTVPQNSEPLTKDDSVQQVQTVEKVLFIKVTSKFPDGLVAGTTLSTYDQEGNLTKEETLNGNGTLGEYKVIEVAAGKLKVSRFNANRELQSRQEILTTPQGLTQKETTFNVKDEVQATSEYTYDDTGKVLTWSTKAPQGNIKTAYFYDKDKVQKILQSDAQGKLIRQYNFEYDEQGLLSMKTELEGDGQIAGQVKSLNKDGKLAREEFLNGKGTLLRAIEYQYDSKGIMIKSTYFGPNGKVTEIKDHDYIIIKKTINKK